MSIKHLFLYFLIINFSTIKAQKMNSKTHIDFLKITNQFSVEDFEQVKNFILKEGNKKTYRNYDNHNPYFNFKKFDAYLGSDIGQKNINNDPKLSDFNQLTLEEDNQYYEIIIVRSGDITAKKNRVTKGMQENEVYLTAYNQKDIETIPHELLIYIEEMLKVK